MINLVTISMGLYYCANSEENAWRGNWEGGNRGEEELYLQNCIMVDNT